MQDFLTDLEVAKIEAFCADTEMFEAVKKVLFSVLYSDGVVKKGEKLNQRNGAFSLIANAYSEGRDIPNDILGASLRAKFEGVHTILDGYDKLKSIKSPEKSVESPYNEAI
jgi:hypothetical protein